MDHHCWWTNNCVAEGTFKQYFLFCAYAALLCFYAFFSVLYFLAHDAYGISSVFEYCFILWGPGLGNEEEEVNWCKYFDFIIVTLIGFLGFYATMAATLLF